VNPSETDLADPNFPEYLAQQYSEKGAVVIRLPDAVRAAFVPSIRTSNGNRLVSKMGTAIPDFSVPQRMELFRIRPMAKFGLPLPGVYRWMAVPSGVPMMLPLSTFFAQVAQAPPVFQIPPIDKELVHLYSSARGFQKYMGDIEAASFFYRSSATSRALPGYLFGMGSRMKEGFAEWSILHKASAATGVRAAGITTSYVLTGAPGSISSWHCEDQRLCSFNQVLMDDSGIAQATGKVLPPEFTSGQPDTCKLWAVASARQTARIRSLQRDWQSEMDSKVALDMYGSCGDALGHKSFAFHPEALKPFGVEVTLMEQRLYDIVLTFADASHMVFNTRHNLCESVNWATDAWRPHGKYTPCNCEHNRLFYDESLPTYSATEH